MNHPIVDVYIQQARRRDDVAAAAHYRLVKEAERTYVPRPAHLSLRPLAVPLAHALAWLGNRLTAWSCSLQSRYLVTERSAAPCASD